MKIFLAIDNNWNPLANVKKISFLDVWDHTSATVDIWWRAKRLCILLYSCMSCSDLLLFYIIAFFWGISIVQTESIHSWLGVSSPLPPVFFVNTRFYILFYILFNIEYPFPILFPLFEFFPPCSLFCIYFRCWSIMDS